MNHSSIARKQVKSLEAAYLQRNGGDLGGNGASMFFGGAAGFDMAKQNCRAAFTACLHEKLQASGSKVKARCSPGLAETDLQSTTVRESGMGEWFASNL